MIKGINKREEKILKDIINKYPSIKFFAYGSRVKGDFVKSSDLDIMLKSNKNLTQVELSSINEEFYNSLLPFIVNLVDFYDIKEDFYQMIKNDLVLLN